MKIPAIQNTCYRQYYQEGCNKNSISCPNSLECRNLELQNIFYYPMNISFGADGAIAMKRLFEHGLPCMYTGKEMIDSGFIDNFFKNGYHRLKAIDVCKHIQPVINCLMDKEKEVFLAIKAQAMLEPQKNIKEIMQTLKNRYEYELIKDQAPIFKTLEAYSYSLPDDLRLELKHLLMITDAKINNTPVYTRFSVSEFRYKLAKIRDEVKELHDINAVGMVNHFLKMSEDFEPKTNDRNINRQKDIVSRMETILKRTVLRDNTEMKELLRSSKAKLNAEKILMPFSRKAFIYDLSQIIKNSRDAYLKQAIMKIAEKLPTSKDSTAAYITKYSNKSCEKIVHQLLWPSLASIEHLLPKSCKGANKLSNYGGACASINSERSSTPFVEWIKKFPDTPKYCQKYVDRLIKYAKNGIFEKEEIDIKYIEDFKQTIATLSEGAIVVDTSKLYKGGRFKKPESAKEYLNLN